MDAGTRYSPATGITKANVAELRVAWTYHTGDAAQHGAAFTRSSFEVTPILAAGKLVFCTPFDRVIALDATNGRELWVFDLVLPTDLHPANDAICRGVAVWHDATVAASRKRGCRSSVPASTMRSTWIAVSECHPHAVNSSTRPAPGCRSE